jgi:lambda family phage portal protein
MAPMTDANVDLRNDVRLMRFRARQQERDSDYIKGYFDLLENNVLGHRGIGLEMKITENIQQGGKFTSQYDTRANQIIEDCWARWGRREFCTIAQTLTWTDVQKQTLRSTARDGAQLHKKHYSGDWGYVLEPMEIDHLDVQWNRPADKDGAVRLGVEFASNGKIVGYWLFSRHPGDVLYAQIAQANREFIPANQILHIFRPNRVNQVTGAPWIHTCATRIKNLDGYEEATVIDARVSAAKGIWLKRTSPVDYQGAVDELGNRQMEVSPGLIEELPINTEPFVFSPNNPNADGPGFIKSQLRGIARGLGISYNSLANDLEGVNYSSIRAGLLEEREEWKKIQEWFISWFIQPVFEEWLQTALALGKITDGVVTLPANKFNKFNKPEWKPRRWDWVDPLKDMQANVLAVEKGFNSRRAIIAEGGGDVETVFADQKEDKVLAEDSGLDFSAVSGVEAKTVKGSEPPQPDQNAG